MKEHEFWRERTSGHVYAILFEDGVVAGSCGPLDVSELEEDFLARFDYSEVRAGWIERHRDDFELYRPAGLARRGTT